MKDMIKNIVGVLAVCLMLPACTQDDRVETTQNADKLSFGISLSGTTTRSLSENNESRLDWIDVFLIDGSNNLLTHERVESPQEVVYLEADKSDYKDKTPFSLYVIANSAQTFNDISTLADLRAMSETTAFYAVETPDRFLMDGYTQVNDVDDNIEVDLKRAAAKIVVTLNYGEEPDEEGNTYVSGGTVEKKIVNYATTTSILEDGDALSVAERALQSTDYIDNTEGTRVVFYSYANDWNFSSDDSESGWQNETYLYLNVPVWVIPTSGERTLHSSNYYRIPLNGFIDDNKDGANSLQRNYLYEIKATVKTLGSSTPDTPLELSDISYNVVDWKDEAINIDGKDEVHYLAVNMTSFDFRNEEENQSLEFASSSPIADIEVIRCWYMDKVGVPRDIVLNDQNQSPGDYKTNTQEEKFPANEYAPKFTADSDNNGKIHIESKLLVNTPKYITIRIANEDGDSQEVTIVQYPLEYITPILGYQSYRTDFGGTTYNNSGNRRTGATINRNTWSYSTGRNSTSATFVSKVRTNYDSQKGTCRINYYYYNTNSNTPQISNESSLNNSNMYHVRITSVSSDYTLGIPQVDDNGYTVNSAENAKIVSPSFMIASQLGAVQNSGWTLNLALDHCSKYVETEQQDDGTEIEYKNWRLPTEAELIIIKDFQNDPQSAMSEVLGGDRYWGANGGDGAVNVKGASGNPYLRCVRDVHVQTTN